MSKNKIIDLGPAKLLDDILKKKDEEKHKFHQIIEKDKTIILNCFKNLPFYKDSITQIEKKLLSKYDKKEHFLKKLDYPISPK